MSDLVGLEGVLEERGFVRAELEGGPPELRWHHLPGSWRERLPVVRGYRRTVVVVDLPVLVPERVDALFDELTRLGADGLNRQLAERYRPPLPWWGYPLMAVALVVAVALTYFVGISIELRDEDSLLVVFRGDRLSDDAVAAVADQVAAGEGFTALGGLWDGVHARLLLPDPPPAALGPHRAGPGAARKDLLATLSPGLRIEALAGAEAVA